MAAPFGGIRIPWEGPELMNEFQRLMRQWKNQIKAWFAQRQGGGNQQKRPQLRMCSVCGRFNDPRATVCEYCDSAMAPAGRQGRAPLPGQGDRGAGIDPVAVVLFFCIGMYLISAYLSGKAQGGSFVGGLFGMDTRTLVVMGSNYVELTAAGEWWRVFTYMFLHGGLIHIFFNMSALRQLGPFALEAYGGWRFWLVSLVTGAVGGLISSAAALFSLGGGHSVGFSGALLGYVGLLWVYFKKTGQVGLADRFKKIMIWLNLICIVLTYTGLFPIDNFAHLGGMFTGILLGFYFHSPLAGAVGALIEKIVVWACVVGLVFGLYQTFHYVDAAFMKGAIF